MKAIHINFASASVPRALRKTSISIWIAGVVSVAFCLTGLNSIATLTQQREALQLEKERLDQQLYAATRPRISTPAPTLSEIEAKALNNAIAQLNLPWRDLWDTLETATPPTVALLSLEPDAKKNMLKGVAEAKNPQDMLHYIQVLKRQVFFETVSLTKHAVNEQDSNRPLRFQFEARWKAGAS